jgi:hypothetical protein
VTRRVDDAVTITLDDDSEVTGTAIHPIWSVTKSDWIPMGELQEGDLIQGHNRELTITAVAHHAWGNPVYNIEVHGEHVYEIGEDGILVHNANDSCALGLSLAGGSAKKAATMRAKGLQAAHIVPNPGWTSGKPLKLIAKLRKAKAALVKAGIDPNDARNGFWAKRGHKGTHRNKALNEIADRILKASKDGNVADVLAKLKLQAQNGRFLNPKYKA